MKYIIKTIVRNFIRKPVTNLINLLGLSVSLSLVIILSVYCYSELTTDNFQKNRDHVFIYGLSEDRIYTPGILKDQIDQNIPRVESTVRIGGSWEEPVFQAINRDPVTSDMIFADEGLFKLFTFGFIEGNAETALNEPMTIAISKSLAHKLFGDEKASGRSITLNNKQSLTVSAVLEEPAANSCLRFNAVASMATRKAVQPETGEFTQWNQCNFLTFLFLKEGVSPVETANTILSLFPAKDVDRYKGQTLVPLKQIYFSKFTLFGSNYLVSGDRRKVMILVLVAFLVLAVALINFINISSSQWQEKIKQTGIMKVIGARRGIILRGVLAESFLFFLAALIIAIDLVNSFISVIYRYTGIHFNERLTYSPGFILASLVVITVLSTLISIIPASRISSSRAIDNIKKSVISQNHGFSYNGLLVIIQIAIAIILIAFTILVQKQVRFGSSNLGFNQENILGIKLTDQLYQKKDVLSEYLSQTPAVGIVSFAQYFPGRTVSEWGTDLVTEGEKKDISFNTFSADAAFFKILGLKLVMGRFYSGDLSTDEGKVIVNEAFLREHKVANPLGGVVGVDKKGHPYEIIGVVQDFHYKPVTEPIAPLVIRNDSYSSYCFLTLRTSDFKSMTSTLENIRRKVANLSPSFPADVTFFDQAIQNMYQSELRFRRIFSLLAACAIIICSLGILAMSIFGCQRRIKEIGIRKVNGAKISEILIMLNKNFLSWVLIAVAISIPVAWYIMHRWLDNFAYKTELSWWIFGLAGLIALTIALFTVSWQSWRAATRNPVEALRYE